MKRYYEVVVCERNAWNASDGSPIRMYGCPHKHRTISGAYRCLKNLQNYNRKTGTQSAKWYNAEIRTLDNEPLTREENQVIENIEYEKYKGK